MKIIFAILCGFIFVNSAFAASDDIEFRKIFSGFLPTLPAADIAQMIYATPQALTVAPTPSSTGSPEERAQQFITEIDKIGQTTNPGSLYAQSLNMRVSAYTPADLYNRLRQKPLTIFIFPGIFSEFITTRAFEEVFRLPDTAAEREFKSKIPAIKDEQCPREPTAICDYSYDLKDLGVSDTSRTPLAYSTIEAYIKGTRYPVEAKRIDKYFDVASIDDYDKKPLVRVVLLHTEGMSLETLGTIRENSLRFTRRLEKYFKLMGTPENIAFLGYSRGSMVALDTLAYNKANGASWVNNVRAMISLGGVNYGTALADDAFNPESNNGKLLNSVKNVLVSLQDFDDKTLSDEGFDTREKRFFEAASRLKHNVEKIGEFVANAKALQNEGFFDLLESAWQQNKGVDINSAINLMITQIENLGNSANGGDSADFWTLTHRRITKLCESIIDATEEMQTSARLAWWGANTLPLNTRYYALSGVMGEGLTNHVAAFTPNSADDHMLVGDYESYKNVSGVLINDSQVAIERVRFWPELNAILNPRNAGMKTEFLGVVGTHHWGLALRVVNENKDGRVNPFPREVLLLSLVTKISTDLISDNVKGAATVAPK